MLLATGEGTRILKSCCKRIERVPKLAEKKANETQEQAMHFLRNDSKVCGSKESEVDFFGNISHRDL